MASTGQTFEQSPQLVQFISPGLVSTAQTFTHLSQSLHWGVIKYLNSEKLFAMSSSPPAGHKNRHQNLLKIRPSPVAARIKAVRDIQKTLACSKIRLTDLKDSPVLMGIAHRGLFMPEIRTTAAIRTINLA